MTVSDCPRRECVASQAHVLTDQDMGSIVHGSALKAWRLALGRGSSLVVRSYCSRDFLPMSTIIRSLFCFCLRAVMIPPPTRITNLVVQSWRICGNEVVGNGRYRTCSNKRSCGTGSPHRLCGRWCVHETRSSQHELMCFSCST